MKNNNGRQEYGIFLDNTQLRANVSESKNMLKSIGDTAVADSARIDNSYKKVAGTIAALGGTVALGALSKQLYEFANAFDKSMKKVSTISDTVTSDVDGFKQQVLDMCTKIPIAADAAGDALYQIVSAGYDGAAGMNLLEVSAKSAIAGMTNTTTAADAITTLLNAYKKSASEAESISDQLFMTAKLGKTTFGELGQSISQAAPIAASFGIETEQVLAAVATLTKSGTPTAQAMTQIRAAIIGASKVLGDGAFQTMTFQDGLAKIADMAAGSESKLRALIPEIEGMNGVLGLTGLNAKMAASDLAALGEVTGETDKAFAKMNAGADAQLTILKNNMLKKFHEAGKGALDIVGDIAKFINNAFETGAIDDVIATIGVLIATLGVYKASLMVTNAVKLVGNNLMYGAESAALVNLLPAKEASKNADIEAAVAKGQLSIKRAEELIAIRAAAQARLEELRVVAQQMAAEAALAAQTHTSALQRALSSKAMVAQRQVELSLAVLSGDAAKIELAEKSLLEAQENRHIAVKERKATANALSIAQSKAKSAATAADTMQQGINTAATNAGTQAKTRMAVATGKLSASFKAMSTAFKANPFGLILTGVTLAISAFSAFGKSVEKSTQQGDDFSKSVANGAASQVASYKKLQNGWNELGDNLKDKEKFIKNSQTAFYNLGISVSSVSDAENVFVKNSNAMLSALTLRAKANAGVEVATKRYGEALEIETRVNNWNTSKVNTPEKQEAYDAAKKRAQETLGATWTFTEAQRSRYDSQLKQLINQYLIEEPLQHAKRLRKEGDKAIANADEINKAVKDMLKENGIKEALKTTSNTPDDKGDQDGKKAAKDYTSNIEQVRQERERAEKDAELQLRQSKIDIMDESLEKTVAQNELNYDKEIEQIERQKQDKLAQIQEWERKEWEAQNPNWEKEGKKFTPKTTQLSSEQLTSFDVMVAAASKKMALLNKDALDAMLNDYMTYEQRRDNVIEDYEKKRKTMQNADGSLKPGVEQGNVDELNRSKIGALAAIDEEFAQREDTYEAWMNQIANYALNQLEQALVEAKRKLKELEESGTTDSKKLSVARAKVNTAQKKVSKAKTNNEASPDKRTIKEWEDLYKALQEVEAEFKAIGDAIGGIAGETINTVGTILTSTLKMVNGIITFATTSITAVQSATTAGVAAIKTVEAASVILTVIAAAMQIAMTIISLFNDDKQYQEEIDNLQERIDQLQWELDNADAVRLNSTFDALKNLRDIYAEVTQEVLKLHAANSLFSQMFGEVIFQNEIMEGSVERLATAYANIAYTAGKALGEEKFLGAKDQLKNIAEQQLLIQQQINAEDSKKDTDHGQIKEWEQKIQELGAEANQIINEIVEEIIGGSSSDIAQELGNAFIDAFRDGEDAAEAWGAKVNDIVADIMKRMLISQFLEKPLGEIFDKYKSKWYKDGQFAGIDAIKDSMGEFANDLNGAGATFQTIWDELPEDIKNMFAPTEETREASQKGIASASQESVDELNGRMTAVQGHTYLLSENSKILVANSNRVLQHLAGIESNTENLSQLENIKTDINGLKKVMDDIALKGIKVK